MVLAYAKPVELAQFNQAFYTANGAFATSRMRDSLREISVPPLFEPQIENAKKRHLSRPNTVEEIRRKRRNRNKQERKRKPGLSRQEKRQKTAQMVNKIQDIVVKQEKKIKSLSGLANKERQRAIDFWRKWDKEKELRAASNL